MRRGFAVIIVLILITMMSSCSEVHDETLISDVRLYDTIWTLPERRASETCDLFPEHIEEGQVEAFRCKHTTYQIVGTGWQVELAIQYDEDAFLSEKERLSRLCKDSPVCGASEFFVNPAYASVWNWNGCFEYAIINEESHTMIYIYLQLMDKDKLEINEQYVPQQYEIEMSNTQEFSIY